MKFYNCDHTSVQYLLTQNKAQTFGAQNLYFPLLMAYTAQISNQNYRPEFNKRRVRNKGGRVGKKSQNL